MSIFTKVKGLRAKKNAFNLSHQIAQTQDIGQIMPCYVHDGILPGSREKMTATSIVRFQAMLAPMQHKVDLYCHYWYVPYRIIDKNFPKFISGDMMRKGETYECPTVSLSSVAKCMEYYIINLNLDANFWLDLLLNPSSFLCYLNYPAFSDTASIPDYRYINAESKFPDTEDLIRLNVRRLQAYFFTIAQNYINENFTLKYKLLFTDTEEIDLTAELFNFALGDFELLNTKDSSVLTAVPGSTVTDLCLAKILLCLYSNGVTYDQIGNTPRNPRFAFRHAWKKDYFTSALPFVQLGEEVTIPIGSGSATVSNVSISGSGYIRDSIGIGLDTNVNDNDTVNLHNGHLETETSSEPITQIVGDDLSIAGGSGYIDIDEFEAGITINELRAANALQSLKEAFARFGTRFQEWLKGFWNVNASDRSQQLPEWLGGYKVPVQISEIEQTNSTENSELEDSGSPLGTLAGKGMGVGGRQVYSRYFEEPGVIVGLCFLQPKAVYPTEGVDRFLLKTNNLFDYFTPKMEHLGEQEIYSCELFMQPTDSANKQTFGYQSRYAEYKQIQSKYRGQFANVLKFWHLGRSFAVAPVLGSNFIYVSPQAMRRPFAVQQVDEGSSTFVDVASCMLWFNYDVKYIAPMSRFGTPALLN